MTKCKFESRAELNAKVLKGVNILADNVAATLGPKGRNVILHQKGKDPFITKDGWRWYHNSDRFGTRDYNRSPEIHYSGSIPSGVKTRD